MNVRAGLLMTIDGNAMWSSNSGKGRRVASTIKMLNALVVRDRAKLTDIVRVPKAAAAISDGGVGLVAGQKLTVGQLLNIMLIASANDAAEALAIHIGGTEKAYVRMMNAKAKSLGLTHTVAADPHGLGKREYSTARDLSILAKNVLADRVLRGIVRRSRVSVPSPSGKTSETYASTNQLLGHYNGIEGVKTGFTDPAGFCFVGAAKRGDVEIVGVVLGTDSLAARFSEMRKLLDWGFLHCHARQVVSKDTTIGLQPEDTGPDTRVVVHPVVSATRAVFDGGPKVTTRIEGAVVRLPVKAGQRLGTIVALQGKNVLVRIPLVALVSASAPATTVALPAAAVPAVKRPPTGVFEQILVVVMRLYAAV
jgi:D-alanyl-D-alanine carboxypeptidase (penicillin-binding protein 5/6)